MSRGPARPKERARGRRPGFRRREAASLGPGSGCVWSVSSWRVTGTHWPRKGRGSRKGRAANGRRVPGGRATTAMRPHRPPPGFQPCAPTRAASDCAPWSYSGDPGRGQQEPGPSRFAAALRDLATSATRSHRCARRCRSPPSRALRARGAGARALGSGRADRAAEAPRAARSHGRRPASVVPGGVERPETLSLSSRGDPNGHRTLRAWPWPSRQTSETAEAETLPKAAEPPSCSAWAVTWASGGPRRRPRRKGAQIRARGWGTAGRLSPFTSSTGSSTSTAHTLLRRSDLREGRGTGTPPSPPRGWPVRPGGASP